MANFRQLRDLYRFPGFVPSQGITGRFGDPMAAVVRLRGVRKKQSVVFAARLRFPITTNDAEPSATFRRATSASICRFSFGGFFVRDVPV